MNAIIYRKYNQVLFKFNVKPSAVALKYVINDPRLPQVREV